MNNLGSRWTEILCGFRSFFFFSAILALTSHASGGTGPLTVNPSNINFGGVYVGSSQTQSVTLVNSGTSNLTITQAYLSGTGFRLSNLSYPVTLAGGQSVTCNVTFTPPSAGTDSGRVSIAFRTSSHGGGHFFGFSTVILPLSGTGLTPGQLTASPTSLDFGSVQVGNVQAMAETLTNSGGSSLTISAASGEWRRIQFEWDRPAFDIERWPEHVVYSAFLSDRERCRQRQRKRHLQRLESQPKHSTLRNGRDPGGADCKSHQPGVR